MKSDSTTRIPGSPSRSATETCARDLAEDLGRFGPTTLGCCCSLALEARELCGDRQVRVELPGSYHHAGERPMPPGAGPAPGSDSDAVWLAVPGPNATGKVEVRLWVEADDDGSLPCLDALGPVIHCASLLLERHRLESELLRATREAARARASLAHRLRGHLNSALLRTESLLRSGVDADRAQMEADLGGIHDAVLAMADKIRDVLEDSESGAAAAPGARQGRKDLVRLQDLLGVDADLPPVRADGRRLEPAMRELLELTRRCGSSPELRTSDQGLRITVSLEAPPQARSGNEGAPPAPEPAPSLPEVVADLGGRIWVEAGSRSGVAVQLVLPAEGSGLRT